MLLLVCACGIAAPAAAQSSAAAELVLEEIIVTAQKRTQAVQDVPISVVVMSGEKIRDADLNDIEELQTYVPNLSITDTALGPKLHIRGMGSGVNQGFEQSVGIYIDGIYHGRAQQSRMPLVDVERVEVLRGTQSILFGKNSIAGALNISTAQPDRVLQAGARVLYGSGIGERKLSGFVSGPLSDSLSGRLSLHLRDTDGYMTNLTLDDDEPQRQERLLRGTLRWDPGDELDITLKAELGSFDVDGEQIEIINDRAAVAGPFAGLTYADVLLLFGQDASVANNFEDGRRSANGDVNRNDSEAFVVTANYRGWDSVRFTSITGYNSYDLEEFCDCDFTGGNVFDVLFDERHDQISQEFRLQSKSGEPVDWLAGVYYQDNDLDFADQIRVDGGSIIVPVVDGIAGPGAGALVADTSAPRTFSQDTRIVSVFGQAIWALADRWRLALGARWSSEKKKAGRVLAVRSIDNNPLPAATEALTTGLYSALFNINPHSLSANRTSSGFMPSMDVQYDINDSTMSYLRYSRGIKSGGFDTRSNNAPANGGSFEFDDETADSYEIGAKMILADGAAEFNVAAYYTDYNDLQVSAFDGVLGFNVGNAARAITRGVEADARWLATENILLTASLAVTDFEYKEFFGECYFGQVPDAADGINCDYRGKSNQFVADYTGTLSLEYLRPVGSDHGLTFDLDLLFVGDHLLSSNLDPMQKQKAYSKVNARLAYGDLDRRWEVALIGKNLTDESVKTLSGDVPLAGSNFGTPGFSSFFEPPRTLAIQVSLQY